MSLQPLPPVDATHLMREVDEALIPLLRSLDPEDWDRLAVGDWTVRDVATHLLDGAVRRLSLDRDGHQPPASDRDLSDYGQLVGFLNELNAVWVAASQRLSPEVITDLLEHVCPQVADYFAGLDPDAKAAFPVSWAGEDSSKVWMDVAREYTERWHHQQQIRRAAGVPGLEDERYLRPLLETFIRAVPRAYASLDAPTGTHIVLGISDSDALGWSLQRQSGTWQLGSHDVGLEADASVEIPAKVAWKLFTKAVSGTDARSAATVTGDERLVEPFFATLAVMA